MTGSRRVHRDLERVRAAAAEVYTPEGVDLYMTAPNKAFGGRSAWQLIEADETERVLQALDQLASGAYA